VWHGLESPFEIEEDELVQNFMQPKKGKKKKGKAEDANASGAQQKKKKKAKKQLTRVLDSKRSNALAIMSSQLPKLPEMRLAMIEMDDKKLGEADLAKILKNLPTKEEIKIIKDKDGPDVHWDKPEKFILMLISIAKLKQRLECWHFALTVPQEAEELLAQTSKFRHACEQLQKGRDLNKIFAAIVAVGNYLNGGTKRGQADGFKIDFLSKISGVKTTDGKSNLLAVVAKLTKDEIPPSEELKKRFDAVLSSGSIPDIEELKRNANRLCGLFKTTKKTIESVKKTTEGNITDKFGDTMDRFVKEKRMLFERLLMQSLKADTSYKLCHGYFGKAMGPEKKLLPSAEFFTYFRGFLSGFVKAIKKEEDKALKESKSNKKKAQNNYLTLKRKKSHRIGQPSVGARDRIAELRGGMRTRRSSTARGSSVSPGSPRRKSSARPSFRRSATATLRRKRKSGTRASGLSPRASGTKLQISPELIKASQERDSTGFGLSVTVSGPDSKTSKARQSANF